MESVSSCKEKLSHFRIKELKDVLTQLGLAKQGKKQDLLNRILATLSEDEVSKQGLPKKNSIGREGVAKIIDDIFRKLQLPGAMDLALTKQNGMDIKPKEEANDSFQLDMKVQCPCGSSLLTESMIQCEDSGCRVWQHIGCVIIPEKPTEGVPPVPSIFYCDLCRIKRADPFWVTLAHPLLPVKLTTSIVSTDGGNPVQNVEKTFQLTRADRDLLQKAEFDVQAWCMLLNDKVSFRMQWPQYSDLQVNGIPVRTTNRPGSQALGANGRDDGAAITSCTKEGTNKIFLSGCDARIFCLGVRIVRRRTVKQVLDMMPKESDGECFEDALARVCRCIGGGNAVEDADSDSDLEVVSDIVTVNLRCPMSGSRIKVAGRFKPCAHMACFDLDTFVGLNQRSRKWQCPLCLKNYSLEHMIIDPYFNRITTLLRDCGEDVNEIEVKPDGSWRAKNEREHKVLGLWHFPDGSLCPTADEAKIPDMEASKEDHKEEVPSGHNGLRLGIRKNRNGIWEVSKPENTHTRSPENRLHVKYENADAMPMSSSATGSCRDGEDPSINQDGGGQFGLSSNNANKLDSLSLNFDPTSTVANIVPSAAVGIENVIVLSDSEDEIGNFISPETHYDSGQADPGDIPFSNPHTGIQDSYTTDPDLDTGGNCLGLYGDNCDDYGMPLWPLPSGTQSSPGFQFFGTEANVSESFVDLEGASAACPPTMNGYASAPDVVTRTATQVANSNSYPTTDISGDLVDNPLALGEVDPSLQMFLPSGPSGTSAPLDLGNQPDIPNGGVTEDWISLRLGGGSSSSSHGETVDENDLNSRRPVASKEDKMESLTNTASLLLGMNDDQSHRTTPKRPLCDGLLSHPRQPRSARPRLNLSIDSNQKYISIDSDSD